MININEILKEYEALRSKNSKELEQRKIKVFKELPRLGEIEEEMISLGLEITKSILFESTNAEEHLAYLKKKQMDLKIEKAETLASNNYPNDYLEPKYDCVKCLDTGFIGLQKCNCLLQKQIEYNYMRSNLSDTKESFDNFNIEYYSDKTDENGLSPRRNMQQIYLECIKFVRDFDNHNRNMLFIGRPGLGKTYLCHSIAKELLLLGKSAIYQSAPDLMDLIRKHKFNFEAEEQSSEVIETINNCDLLIIDDLGTELTTQFSGLVLYNILNKRLLNSKKMVIATNLDVKEIMRDYSERITSRMFGNFDLFEFFGDDIRLLIKMS